ncbi:DUF3231 family protein [Sutcliffiella cohnii]|uniref:DUF3231 family protein n=1 Tax=Sutcliffiella cohnii TaxID=33932 RepID=UPI002E1FC5D3|nr:DUF3231 family protein [Sutcliffiella cohnii]
MKNDEMYAAEISTLWTLHINITMTELILRYFLEHVDDLTYREEIVYMYEIVTSQLESVKKISWEYSLPPSIGFTENDVNLQAPRLFSDPTILTYLFHMNRVGMITYSSALATVTNKDIRHLYHLFLVQTADIYERIAVKMTEKGALLNAPSLTYENTPSFIIDKDYLSGINPLKEKRPLNAIEVTHLSFNLRTNQVGRILCEAFTQVTKNKEVQKFSMKAKEMAKSHMDTFINILRNEDIEPPFSEQLRITDSTISPFSDKLIMTHTAFLTTAGIGNYAAAAAASQRSDLIVKYEKLSGEAALLSKEGADIMIKNKWIEKPPTAVNRKQLRTNE